MKKKGIILEVLTTENAISTYNYLLEEGDVHILWVYWIKKEIKIIQKRQLPKTNIYIDFRPVFPFSFFLNRRFAKGTLIVERWGISVTHLLHHYLRPAYVFSLPTNLIIRSCPPPAAWSSSAWLLDDMFLSLRQSCCGSSHSSCDFNFEPYA